MAFTNASVDSRSISANSAQCVALDKFVGAILRALPLHVRHINALPVKLRMSQNMNTPCMRSGIKASRDCRVFLLNNGTAAELPTATYNAGTKYKSAYRQTLLIRALGIKKFLLLDFA